MAAEGAPDQQLEKWRSCQDQVMQLDLPVRPCLVQEPLLVMGQHPPQC